MLRNLLDRILPTEGIREEWEIFYKNLPILVWQEEFESIVLMSDLRKIWLSTIAKVEQKAKLEDFQFSQ